MILKVILKMFETGRIAGEPLEAADSGGYKPASMHPGPALVEYRLARSLRKRRPRPEALLRH